MNKLKVLLLSILFTVMTAGAAFAVPVLYDSGITVNGGFSYLGSDIYSRPEVGGLVTDVTGFLDIGGAPSALGSVTMRYTPGAAGTYSIFGWFDAEIDEGFNSYVNETGAEGGVADGGQSGNVLLYEANPIAAGNDVALEIGWDFTLLADQWAEIVFGLSSNAPVDGSYFLSQTDLNSDETIYLTSTLRIGGDGPPPPAAVPEPGTIMLLGSGLIGLGMARRKRIGKK